MSNTDTSLHTAVQNNDINAVTHLLQSGHDPHAANDVGQTPLDIAIQSGNADIAVLLAGHGAPAITAKTLHRKSFLQNILSFVSILTFGRTSAKTLKRYFFLWDILLFVSILTFGRTSLIWVLVQYLILYRCWKLIPADIARTTPSKAVLFLLVPIFNLYWMFIAYAALGQDINKTLRRRGIQYQIDTGWGYRYCQFWLLMLPAYTALISAFITISAKGFGIVLVILVILVVVGLIAAFINLFMLINYLGEIKKGALALLENNANDAVSEDGAINQDNTDPEYKIPYLSVTIAIIVAILPLLFL